MKRDYLWQMAKTSHSWWLISTNLSSSSKPRQIRVQEKTRTTGEKSGHQTEQAMIVNMKQKVPIRYIFHQPTISITEQRRIIMQSHKRAFTETGQRTKAFIGKIELTCNSWKRDDQQSCRHGVDKGNESYVGNKNRRTPFRDDRGVGIR